MGYLHRKMIDGLTRFAPAILPAQRHYYNETNNDRWIVEYIFSGKRDGSIRSPISRLLKSKGYRSIKNPFNRDKPW